MEQSKVLPQCIADWVDGRIVVVATTCDMYVTTLWSRDSLLQP